jgi:mono/diheme cytochrome c family protein
MRLTLLFLALAGVNAGQAAPATFGSRVAPVLQSQCIGCHGPKRQKGGLRLDTLTAIRKGGEDGPVIEVGDPAGSELVRRLTLPTGDDDRMPSDDKPALKPGEIALIQSWIAAGAPALAEFDSERFTPAVAALPAAPGYPARLAAAQSLASSLGVRLIPRSRLSTDGLILRTASAPRRCDDAVLQKLAPMADLIVDAELSRTRVTDQGLATLAGWPNLARVDLTHTAVTAAGVAQLEKLPRLETLNLTATAVDATPQVLSAKFPALKEIWVLP